jgi:hypothetical protein
LDLDTRELGGTYLDGQGQALKEREIHMDVEPLCLISGEAIGNGEIFLAHRSQMIESLFEPEVGQIVGAKLVSKMGWRTSRIAGGRRF